MTSMTKFAAAVPYGTDLGRLNPDCTATRHGTYSAYHGGCRCPHAREAHRIYQKRHREGRTEQRIVDGCGTRRRIQAMWSIGHSSQTISDATDGAYSTRHIQLIAQRASVNTFTRDAIASAYRRLASVPGTSVRTRARAAVAGYPSPMRWGADIDDPAAVPDPDDALLPESDFVDHVAVELALEGSAVTLTGPEQAAALRMAVGRGEPLSSVSNRLGINYAGARQMLGGELTPRRSQQLRVEAELARIGHIHNDATIAALVGVHHQTVTRARERLARRQQQLAS